MGIRFQCHHCGHALHVKDFQAGKRGRCPACKDPFRIPLKDAPRSLAIESAVNEPGDARSEQLLSPSSASAVATAVRSSKSEMKRADAIAESTANDVAVPATAPEESWTYPAATALDGAAALDAPAAAPPSTLVLPPPRVISEAPNATWYIRPVAGGQYGPAPSDIVWQWLREDRVGVDALVWREDWPQWLPANQVFAEFFQAAGLETHPAVAVSPAAGSSYSAAGAAAPTTPAVTAGTSGVLQAREAKIRGRKFKYTVAIVILVALLAALAGGLAWVLYSQKVL